MPLRVLIVFTDDLSQSTGSKNRARLLAAGLTRQGAVVAVLAGGISQQLVDQGIENVLFESGRSYVEQIVDYGQRFKPDVVFGITEGGARSCIEAARSLDVAVVIDIHGIGFIEYP